jgi:hypothetical protein
VADLLLAVAAAAPSPAAARAAELLELAAALGPGVGKPRLWWAGLVTAA